jgi:hypothetical protein
VQPDRTFVRGNSVIDRLAADPLIAGMSKLALIKEGLDLVVELWPKPGYASVTMETHQWVRLRRVLLAIPDLVAADE